MFTSSITKLRTACLHYIGSKAEGEGVVLSSSPLVLDEHTIHNLIEYCFSSFKEEELFCFFNELGLDFNEVYGCVKAIFDTPDSFLEYSQKITRFLYEKSEHPNIKRGDIILAHFTDCEVNGLIVDALGIFKAEGRTDFLSLDYLDGNSSISTLSGLDIKKVDKAALIFNDNADGGFSVAVIDHSNRSEARYWTDDFLHVRRIKDNYARTKSMLSAAKNYITKQLPSEIEVSKADQASLLSRSIEYFKNNEEFNLDSFSEEVMGSDNTSSRGFNDYLNSYCEANDIDLTDSFQISDAAVRRQSRSIRSVIKLDKNFHIYVHGGDQMIKRGYDEETGLPYYQLFFKEES